jgi:DNA (cytosine-5)-methyltransferase 1
MKRDACTFELDLGNELIIDNFAGGGGTSTGLELAFGRPVDIAINHDPEALAMHAINHPHTKHLCESVWDIDPIEVTGNRPVGLVWLSPDCKHFSKAKGGKPVEKKIRGLAWVTLRWAAKCKPRVIMLENVEEFKTWGPLLIEADGSAKPDPAKRGKTFDSFVRQLRAHGYSVDYRELRASDYNTPTIRKRFFMVARRDGLPICWPEQTNGAPTSPAVLAGKQRPWRTAAECIDWSLPCNSIFERKKPLAEATLRRIAKGIMRYVVEADQPFIVGQGGPIYSGKPVSTEQPFGTLTTENHRAPVVPSIVPVTHQGGDRNESVNEPFRTITGAQRGEKALAQATLVPVSRAAEVAAFLTEHANASNQRVMPADEPLRTICAQVKGGHFSMVSAELAPFVMTNTTGHLGAELGSPIPTVTSAGNQALVSAHITKFRTGATGSDLADPLPTITAGPKENPAGAAHALGIVTAHIQRDMGQSVGHAADTSLGTVTAGGGGKSALVTANLIHMGHGEGAGGGKRFSHGIRDVEQPLNTVTASGAAGAVVASTLVKLRGTSNAAAADEPIGTISAQGQHHAEVRAFLVKYYGTDQDPRLEEPLHTVTTKDRYGLVKIQGVDYQIVDIGLRMLAPHELYRAQGFPTHYIIDEIPDPAILFKDGHQADGDPLLLPRVPLTKSSQVRMCGNSVCPPLSEALVRANFMHEHEIAKVA